MVSSTGTVSPSRSSLSPSSQRAAKAGKNNQGLRFAPPAAFSDSDGESGDSDDDNREAFDPEMARLLAMPPARQLRIGSDVGTEGPRRGAIGWDSSSVSPSQGGGGGGGGGRKPMLYTGRMEDELYTPGGMLIRRGLDPRTGMVTGEFGEGLGLGRRRRGGRGGRDDDNDVDDDDDDDDDDAIGKARRKGRGRPLGSKNKPLNEAKWKSVSSARAAKWRVMSTSNRAFLVRLMESLVEPIVAEAPPLRRAEATDVLGTLIASLDAKMARLAVPSRKQTSAMYALLDEKNKDLEDGFLKHTQELTGLKITSARQKNEIQRLNSRLSDLDAAIADLEARASAQETDPDAMHALLTSTPRHPHDGITNAISQAHPGMLRPDPPVFIPNSDAEFTALKAALMAHMATLSPILAPVTRAVDSAAHLADLLSQS